MIRISIIVVFFSFITPCLSQTKINEWLTGAMGPGINQNTPDTGNFTNAGANLFNFNSSPFNIKRQFKSLGNSLNCINMWDKNGNILFYSNGSKVFNASHQLIENADSLNYSSYWNFTADNGYYANYIIGEYSKSMVCIQNSLNPNQFYLISTIMNYDSVIETQWLRFHKIVYSIIDMSLNNGKGKMIVKEKLLTYGDFSHALSACKHANGKDWWIVARKYQNSNCYLFFKLDQSGIKLDHEQCIGEIYTTNFPDNMNLSYGSNFSNDGKLFSILSYSGLELFNFNRCTGFFSNPKYAVFPFGDSSFNTRNATDGVSFSPSNQYLYVIYAYRVVQFDVLSSEFEKTGVTIANYDGFVDNLDTSNHTVGFQTTFWTSQLAPDGKIYIGTGDDTRYLHEIEYPDKKGLASHLVQHKHKTLTFKSGVPYYPNYSLDADSSSCSSWIHENNQKEIAIYPIPTQNILYLESNSTKPISYEIRNYIGQLIAKGKTRKEIDVTKLENGVYIIKLDLDNESSQWRTFRIEK